MSNTQIPQNIEAEEAVLGGILLDYSTEIRIGQERYKMLGALLRVRGILRPEMFSISSHQILYQEIETLHEEGRPTDLMTVTSWLADRNLLEQVGGQAKLAQLMDRTVSAVNIDYYATLVEEKFIRRQLVELAESIATLAASDPRKLSIIKNEIESKLCEVSQPIKRGEESAFLQAKVKEIISEPDEFAKELKISTLLKNKSLGLTQRQLDRLILESTSEKSDSDFYQFGEFDNWFSANSRTLEPDWLIDGFIEKGEIVCLTGEPGSGKSTLASQIAIGLAEGQPILGFKVNQPKKVIYAVADESPQNLIQRMWRQNGCISRCGFSATVKANFLPLQSKEGEAWTIKDLDALKSLLERQKPDVLILDHIGSIISDPLGLDLTDQKLCKPLYRLIELLRKHRCALILLSHTNKEGRNYGRSSDKVFDSIWKIENLSINTGGFTQTNPQSELPVRFLIAQKHRLPNGTTKKMMIEFDTATLSYSLVPKEDWKRWLESAKEEGNGEDNHNESRNRTIQELLSQGWQTVRSLADRTSWSYRKIRIALDDFGQNLLRRKVEGARNEYEYTLEIEEVLMPENVPVGENAEIEF